MAPILLVLFSTLGDTIRETDKTGAKTGLKLLLNIDQDEYVGMLTPVAGARLAIHNPFHRPFPGKRLSHTN